MLAFALAAALSSPAADAADPASSKSPVWTRQDSLEASAIVNVLALRPESIDSLVTGALMRDHPLGFGRLLREAWINPAGKLGFAFKIHYEGGRAAGFEAKPVMNYGGLRARYLSALAPAFRITPGPRPAVEPLLWNLAAAGSPLPADSLKMKNDSLPSPAVRHAVAYYMTPFSGTLYGIRGGEAGQLLENRDHFIGITEILMADKRLARYLMRSVNPATRLTAAEFIIRHKESFPDYDALQATTFRVLFSNPPKAATMRGSMEASENPRKLVLECAGQEARRDGLGVLRMY